MTPRPPFIGRHRQLHRHRDKTTCLHKRVNSTTNTPAHDKHPNPQQILDPHNPSTTLLIHTNHQRHYYSIHITFHQHNPKMTTPAETQRDVLPSISENEPLNPLPAQNTNLSTTISSDELRKLIFSTLVHKVLQHDLAVSVDAHLTNLAHNVLSDRSSEAGNIVIITLQTLAMSPHSSSAVRSAFLAFLALWYCDNPDTNQSLLARKDKLRRFLQFLASFLSVSPTPSPHASLHFIVLTRLQDDAEEVLPRTIIVSLFHFIDNPRQTFTTPPPKASVFHTPLKPNSASHMNTSTTHSFVDPRLSKELENHLWETDHSFFDHFFPDRDITIPAPNRDFPISDPSQDNVVAWFMDYQQILQSTTTSQWAWQTSGQRYLLHQKSQRKIDLFTYPFGATPPNGQYNWSQVAVLGELKLRKPGTETGDFNKKLVVQLAGYVREVFASQPSRRFVHAFTLVNDRMRCWVFTRSGGVASPRITLSNPTEITIFRRVFWSYLQNADLGLAGGNDLQIPRLLEVAGTQCRLGNPFVTTPAIVTRGTTCWPAHHDLNSESSNDNDSPYVMKASWRYSTRESEGVLLQLAATHGVKGIAVYLAHKDVDSVHDILGKHLKIISNVKLKKRPSDQFSSRPTKRTKTSGFATTTDSAISLWSGKRSRTSASASKQQNTISRSAELSNEFFDPNLPSAVPDRINTRLLTSRGIPITDWDKPLDLLRSMRDAIRGHRSLLTLAKILHRDISTNNIMMTHPLHPRKDGFHGFLIDLDLAIPHERAGPCGAPERTGTYEFLSIEALKGGKGHYFHDDLQSFFFVLLWLVYERDEGLEDHISGWGSTPHSASDTKYAQTHQADTFDCILERFTDKVGRETKTVAIRFRNALWPELDGKSAVPRDKLEQNRDAFYDEVDKAFEWGIHMIETGEDRDG